MGNILALSSFQNGIFQYDGSKDGEQEEIKKNNKSTPYSNLSQNVENGDDNNNNESKVKGVTLSKITEVSEDEKHLIYADYLITSSIFPMVLNVALELDLLGIMARAATPSCQLSAAEIAAQLPIGKNPEASASMLDRILRLLASNALLTCSIGKVDGRTVRRYGLSPVGKYLVPDDDGVCLKPLLSMAGHKAFRLSRSKLKDAILEGGNPFHMAHGMSAFEYAAVDKSFNEVFNTAMRNYSTVMMKKLVDKYGGFKGVEQLVEVAGGSGHLIRNIVSKYPSIKGVNFDLPHVIQNALPLPGVEHISGDMFQSVPRGDAILMKWIIHDWDDDKCIKLLKNCYESLPEKGKVIIIEGILSEKPETSVEDKAVSQMDIAMLTQMEEGKERTREEIFALSHAAGFFDIKFTCNFCNYWIIELHK